MVETSVNCTAYKASFPLFFSSDVSGSSLFHSVTLNAPFPKMLQICEAFFLLLFFLILTELFQVGIIAHLEAVLLYFCGHSEAVQQLLLILLCV